MLKKAKGRLRRVLLASAAILTLAATPTIASPATPADAVVVGFDPGNIISDTLFYDGQAMTVAEIQTFMNQRVPRCTIGDPGREAGMVWGTTHISDKCLRNFTMNTSSINANPYCAAYTGKPGETSAEIIAKVAQACGISPKVLLVTLEKEQSLVSDSWPTVRQLAVATGYACPDSGPNWAANCNPQYYGFQNQVYYAAWQFKVYKAHPNSYNYKPFQTNTIQWHPNPACGTSQVYIENWATAGLYIYTPYRPNQAALNAGWGTGDACSSYGNRNFFNLYSAWFGDSQGDGSSVPEPEETNAEIDAKHAQYPALGNPTTPYNVNHSNGGGTVRGYDHGVITLKDGATEAFVMIGAVRTHYSSHALGLGGPLGWPTSDLVCNQSTGCKQSFENGNITLISGVASIEIPEITEFLDNTEFEVGALTSSARAYAGYGEGFVQGHQHAAVTWKPGLGVAILQGEIRSTLGRYEGITGPLGWPVAPESHSPLNGGGQVQGFENGAITSSPYGGFALTGEMRDEHRARGGLGGELGWPASHLNRTPLAGGGLIQAFQFGALAMKNGTDSPYLIEGEIRAAFNRAGSFATGPGWPTSDASYYEANGGGWVQGFENAAIVETERGAFVLSGEFRKKHRELGGINGSLGWPTTDQIKTGAGNVQHFQYGAVVQRAGTTELILVVDDVFDVYMQAGGVNGIPGLPISALNRSESNGGGDVQGFQYAAITSSDFGTHMISGEMRKAFGNRGGLDGEVGWPSSPMTCSAGICTQEFQHGTLTVSELSGSQTFVPR